MGPPPCLATTKQTMLALNEQPEKAWDWFCTRPPKGVVYVSRTFGLSYISGFQPTHMYPLSQFLHAQIQTPHMLPGKSSSRDFVAELRSHIGQIAASKWLGEDPFPNALFQRIMWHQWPPGHPAEFMKAGFQPTCQRTSSHHRKHLCGFPL